MTQTLSWLTFQRLLNRQTVLSWSTAFLLCFIYFFILKLPPWRTCIGFYMVQSWKMNKIRLCQNAECKKFGCYISTFEDWGSPLLQPDSSSDSIISCYSTRQGVKIEPVMSRQDRLQLLQQSGPHLQQHAALCSKCAELACGDTRILELQTDLRKDLRLKFYKLVSQYYVSTYHGFNVCLAKCLNNVLNV